jgi:peptidoglycan hydrolase CwlO-like protein
MSKDSPTSIPRPHEFQFCCGTTCDAAANLEYVKQLELSVLDLEERNLHLVRSICHANDKNTDLHEQMDLRAKALEALAKDLNIANAEMVELQMTLKARDRALRILRSPTFVHPDHMG